MIIHGLLNRFKRFSFYLPITLYFLLFAVATAVAWQFLQKDPQESETAFGDILRLLVQVAFFFGGILIGIALLTVLISLVFFLYKRKKGGVAFQITTDLKESELHQKQTVRLNIDPILKPVFGFVKLRLQYDEEHFSDKFSLLENRQNTLFGTSISGTYHWPLPAIKEYHVQKAILYFEDVFQFFSLAVDLPASNHFFTQPKALDRPGIKVSPRKTEETTTRIEELRKVEGEYLNYKNFENNDDVRRIVWKIYAKNKELVVRIPEIMDPYASHVYLYASFFTHFATEGNTPVEVPFLNYYKTMVWTIYRNLVKQGFEVKYIADQDIAKKHTGDEQQAVKYAISTSHWQTQKTLKDYCDARHAAIVVISSLSDVAEVKDLMEKHGDITFIFVRLTESLKEQNMLSWVQWVFIQNEKNNIERYRSAWSLSVNLRSRVAANEKKLAALLGKEYSTV